MLVDHRSVIGVGFITRPSNQQLMPLGCFSSRKRCTDIMMSVQISPPPSHTRGYEGGSASPSKPDESGRWAEGAEYRRHTCMLMFLKQLLLN